MKEKIESIVQEVSNAVTANRKRLMGFGIVSLILGGIGIFMSTTVTIASVFVFGLFITVVGIMSLIESFSAPEWKGKLLGLLLSILYVVSGVIMMVNPFESAIMLTLFVAGFLIATGILRIIMGFKIKDEIKQWGWAVFSGVLNIIMGIMIFMDWPYSGTWVIGLFVSIELVMQGINSIVLSQSIKQTQEDIKATTA